MLVVQIPKFQSQNYFMVAAPLLLIRLRGNLGRDLYFLFGVWSACVCSKSFRLEEPIKRMASPRVEAVQDSIQGHIYISASPVNTDRLVRQHGTSGMKPAPEGQALRIAVQIGFGWSNC